MSAGARPHSPGAVRAALRLAAGRAGTLPLAAMALGVLVQPAAGALFGALAWVFAATVFCALMAMEDGGAGLAATAVPGWPSGRSGASLAGGCRGAALVWALTAPYLPPAGHLFMALTILPIYGLPPLVAALAMRGAAKPGVERSLAVPRRGPSPRA